MRLVCSSDWHGKLPELPEGDVLILGGDLFPITNHNVEFQREFLNKKLLPHLKKTTFPHIIVIGGNHDFLLQNDPEAFGIQITYLQDSGSFYNGLTFWGAPWSNWLPGWVFMLPDDELAKKWSLIPEEIDVLITHGPAYGVLDKTCPIYGSLNVGSKSLRQWIVSVNPKVHICGHIHEGFGRDRIGLTDCYNVSLLDEHYVRQHDPVVIDL
jgi:Icc-related predicted phosphoesterase